MADLPEILITGVVGVISATIASVTTYLIKRKPAVVNAGAAQLTAEANAQNSVNDGFAKLNAALMKRMDEQDELIQALKGEVENLSQHVYSLENELRRNGLPIPVRVRPAVFSVVPGGAPQ